MELRDMMIDYNENDYYNPELRRKFTFGNHLYECEPNYAYLNSRLDGIFKKHNLNVGEDFMLLEPLATKVINSYMDKVVRYLFNNGYDREFSSEVIYDITNLLDEIAFLLDRGAKTSLDVSLISIAQAIIHNPEIEEFFRRDSYDDEMSADEVQAIRDKETKEITKLEIPGLSTMLRSGNGVKSDQMYNIFKSLTLRTRINNVNEIYPVLIHDNWINGLSTFKNLFIESNIARKSMLMNKQNISDAGEHNRDSSILAQDIRITEHDCGSKHYVEYTIEDEKKLKALEFKYYLDEDTNELKVISTSDTHLIGKTLKFRSALKCSAKEGGVCEICFGKHAKWNETTEKYNMDVGIEFAKRINGEVGQLVLSFKHTATPYLKKADFLIADNESGEVIPFDKVFKKIKFNTLIFNEGYKAHFMEEDLVVATNSNGAEFVKTEDTEFGEYDIVRVNKIYITNEKEKVTYIMIDNNNVPFKVKSKGLDRYQKKNEGEPILIDNEEDKLMYVLVNTHSTMKYTEISALYQLDTVKEKLSSDIDPVQWFIDQVMQSSFKYENTTTLEVIFKNKVRDPKTYKMSKVPDFTLDNPDVVILSMEKAIQRSLSLSSKIPAGHLNTLFKDPFYHNPANLKPSAYDMLYDDKYEAYEKEEESELV